MRKVDVYVNLKKYAVTEAMVNGAKAMAKWYAENGNADKAESIEMLFLQVENGEAIGQVWGKLNAYGNRFAKLVAA